MNYQLKSISKAGIAEALAKVELYRYLNEPEESESICRDILAVEPDNQQAWISLILALTDQIPHDRAAFAGALATAARLESPYDRAYYTGIAWERRAAKRRLRLRSLRRSGVAPAPIEGALVPPWG